MNTMTERPGASSLISAAWSVAAFTTEWSSGTSAPPMAALSHVSERLRNSKSVKTIDSTSEPENELVQPGVEERVSVPRMKTDLLPKVALGRRVPRAGEKLGQRTSRFGEELGERRGVETEADLTGVLLEGVRRVKQHVPF